MTTMAVVCEIPSTLKADEKTITGFQDKCTARRTGDISIGEEIREANDEMSSIET